MKYIADEFSTFYSSLYGEKSLYLIVSLKVFMKCFTERKSLNIQNYRKTQYYHK